MWLSLDGDGPVYRQLYRALRGAILAGDPPPGARLPPTRELGQELGVSRNVVLLAYEQLLAEGYVQGRVGAGTFVARELPRTPFEPVAAGPVAGREPTLSRQGQRMMVAWQGYRDTLARRPLRYDFRYGIVATDPQARRQWRQLTARLEPELGPDYGQPGGLPALRQVIVHHVAGQRGVRCSPEQVVVVNGSQQGLDLVARLLLDPGERVVVEEPGYRGARHAFTAAGAQLLAVAVDGEGLDPARLPEEGVRLAHVTPSHQFPTGAVLPLARRLALLEWARRTGAWLLEDDYDSEFRYQGRPLEALQGLDGHGRVLYLGTFSKVLSPALRLGYLILPGALVEPFLAAKWLADRHTPLSQQRVLAAFMEEGHFERHLRRMRTLYDRRRQALLEALARHLGEAVEVTGTNAGIHLLAWLRQLPVARLDELVRAAAGREVGVYPVNALYRHPPERAGLLMGYAALNEEDIGEGVVRLASALSDAVGNDGGRRFRPPPPP